MTELAADQFYRLDPSVSIANDAVFPHYLGDRRLRISIARINQVQEVDGGIQVRA